MLVMTEPRLDADWRRREHHRRVTLRDDYERFVVSRRLVVADVPHIAPGRQPEVIEVKDEVNDDNEYIDVVNYFESEKISRLEGVGTEKYNGGTDYFQRNGSNGKTNKFNEMPALINSEKHHVVQVGVSPGKNRGNWLEPSVEKMNGIEASTEKAYGQLEGAVREKCRRKDPAPMRIYTREEQPPRVQQNNRESDTNRPIPERKQEITAQSKNIIPIDLTRSPTPPNRDEIKILKPEEINKDFANQPSQKYHLLKQQLSSEPLATQIVISRNLNNQIEKQSLLNRQRVVARRPDVVDESLLNSECCRHEQHLQPYVINVELSGGSEAVLRYSVDDLALRYRVLVFLWILLGERRLINVGYPSDSVHLVLWRVVHICCSISGVKSAAAVPLPGNHDCGSDMLCFRDHVHRFLEVCAPTRDHWKQFGWASLTVDAVLAKIYKTELVGHLLRHTSNVPVPIRMAMCKLANLDKVQATPPPPAPPPPPPPPLPRHVARWRRTPRPTTPLPNRPYLTTHYRPILPKPVVVSEKRKRGRPVKLNRTPIDTAGRIERVMLWRFVLNLLEEPGNAACIHWLNRDEGIFRILNTDWLARIWGRRHGNPRMTYEKMARAMRTYYRSKVLQPVPRNKNLPRKLVYRFNPALIKRVTNK